MMQHATIFTALSLPGVSAQPSANCLQWTADGQLVILTRYAVYLLTPDIALGVDRFAATKRHSEVETAGNKARPVGWVRTMIEYDRSLVHQWSTDSLEWRAVSLGSLDLVLRSVAPSPGGLGGTAGLSSCVFALLNSNMEVTIWGPVKNHLQGEWTKLLDVTAALRDHAERDSNCSALHRVLRAQVTSIVWSTQADFDVSPAPMLDTSLLAAGSRSGTVIFLRLEASCDSAYTARHVATAEVSKTWITMLAWSEWRVLKPKTCGALLACASSDGSISIVEVEQLLQLSSRLSPGDLEDPVTTSVEVRGSTVCVTDCRSITGLQWIHPVLRSPILAYCKPGVLYLWSDAGSAEHWSGTVALKLRTQKVHAGSTAFSPITGISYHAGKDALVVSLSDGSLHVVHQVSTHPSWDTLPHDDCLSSEKLTRTARDAFAEVETEPVLSKDVNRTNGFVPFDQYGTYAWIHEASRPTDFSYKHDAKHVSMFVTAQLWSNSSDDSLTDELRERLEHCRAAATKSPSSVLRSVMMDLRDSERLARVGNKIIDILRTTSVTKQTVDVQTFRLGDDINSQLRTRFKDSLSSHLFGWDAITRLRLCLGLAQFCQKKASELGARLRYQEAVQSFTSAISQHVLKLIVRHAQAAMTSLNAPDVAFVSRVAAIALLSGCPAELLQEADDIVAKCEAARSGQKLHSRAPTEQCPACQALISLQDISVANCPNGHVWTRCCITTYILSTAMVRTCVGCGRKAFLPASRALANQAWLPESARESWLAQDLLDAALRCPICAENFVSLV